MTASLNYLYNKTHNLYSKVTFTNYAYRIRSNIGRGFYISWAFFFGKSVFS